MSTENTRTVVRQYVQALVDRDVDALRAAFAPDATWTFPGELPVSGTWTGPEGIIDGFLGRMTQTLDPQTPVTVEFRNLVADGDQAVAEWTSRARSKDGRPYKNDYAVVFHVRAGKIVEVREYLDTLHVAQVLFTQPAPA
jgi:uncharacterized protein